ncbi:MAG: hypothetical protein L0219_12470 [Phycisphaerales bacterium]|nr:hypothetical protein [Phycisphaerales bacterium]
MQPCRALQVMAILAAGVALGVDSNTHAAGDDLAQSSIRVLKRAAAPQPDGSHLGLLLGLRRLGDPDLKEFFERLLKDGHWTAQVHAALGLAEISPDRQIDPSLVSNLAPEAQESVVATGLDLELLTPEHAQQILSQDGLSPMARILLLAELVWRNELVDQEDLGRLAKSDDLHICGLASCLMAQLGMADILPAYQSRLAQVGAEVRLQAIGWLLDAIRRYDLSACAGWLHTLLNDENNAKLAMQIQFTLLEIDPVKGQDVWRRWLGENPSYQQRMQYGLGLLTAGAKVPSSAYEPLTVKPYEELLGAMARVGKAISSDSNEVADALIDLLDLDHAISTEWAINFLVEAPPDQAQRVYSHLIDRTSNAQRRTGQNMSLAVRGAAKLNEINPEQAIEQLQKAPDDSPQQEAILLGLLERATPESSRAASSIRRIGSGRADSLTLILMSRHSTSLTPEDLEKLGLIAGGAGRVPAVLEVQAAWLYLKHAGQSADLVKRVFSDP